MAEIKNSFLRSKMNKDLDDRLIPNGEYRDAQNISVGQSEADDIGALENVLGNTIVYDTAFEDTYVGVDVAAASVTITNTLLGGTLGNLGVVGNYSSSTIITNIVPGMMCYHVNEFGNDVAKQLVTESVWNTIVGGTTIIKAPSFNTVQGDQYRFYGSSAGTIFLNGNYASDTSGTRLNIEVGMEARVISGSFSGQSATVASITYNTVTNSTLVTYTGNNNNFGKRGNVIRFLWPLKTIGYLSDKGSDSIYTFMTDNDGSVTGFSPTSGLGSHHYITKYVPNSSAGGDITMLAYGPFLNFSQTSDVTGVSLVENLLFWTDNRNQPRKINIENPSSYYTEENQISVAKYNPYQPISLLRSTKSIITQNGTTRFIFIDTLNLAIKKGMSVIGPSIPATAYVYVTSIVDNPFGSTYVILNVPVVTTIGDELTFLGTTMTGEDISTYFNEVEMPNTTTWPGDPDYLESRYVRFSYRFQFDDGEYSLMAPFTQIAYIPKQKGYFLNGDESSSYRSTVVDFMENGVQNIDLIIPLPDSGVNLVSQTNYKISNIEVLYKESDQTSVKVLDRLSVTTELENLTTNLYTYNYQSRKPFRTLSQSQTVRVYDKVPVRAFAQEIAGNRVIYGNFQSQHTPPANINYYVTSGNKNTVSQTNWAEYPNHSLKQNRNYQVGFVLSDKYGRSSSVILSSVKLTGVNTGGIQYGGSTVYTPYDSTSSNVRNWFGDALQLVVGAPLAQNEDLATGAPGLYAKPIGSGFNTFQTLEADQPTVNGTSYIFKLGTPSGIANIPVVGSYLRGQYKDFVKVTSVSTSNATTGVAAGGNNFGIQISLDDLNYSIQVGDTITGLVAGNGEVVTQIFYQSGGGGGFPLYSMYVYASNPVTYQNNDVITFTGSNTTSVVANGDINSDIYTQTEPAPGPDSKYAYTLGSIPEYNATGWYSYKIVVRQQEQDYYNVYLPGIINGYPDQDAAATNIVNFPNDEDGETANIVLINDNINKIPRDLSEVGPDQKQFRSSVQLFGRVTNIMTTGTPGVAGNIQYYPGVQTDTAISISAATDANMAYEIISNQAAATPLLYSTLSDEGQASMYQLDSNPLIARLSTSSLIGAKSTDTNTTSMVPFLAIYETEPQDSLLDIYWETTQSGLIADLNADVLNGFDGPANFSGWQGNINESATTGDSLTAGYFHVINNTGVELPQIPNPLPPATSSNGIPMTMTVTNGLAADVTSQFTLDQNLTNGSPDYGRYRILLNASFLKAYLNNSSTVEIYNFTFIVAYQEDTNVVIQKTGALINIQPSFNDGNVSWPNKVVAQNIAFVVQRLAVNGGSANTGAGLFYSLDAATIAAGYFSIDQSGNITKLSSTPVGNYSITVRVDDAYDPSATPNLGSGTLFRSVIQTVTVGPEPVNAGVISNCKSFVTPNLAGSNQITAPISGVAVSGVWYLSDNTYTASDFPSETITTNTSESNFLHKLGTSLTAGTVLFSCNMQQSFTDNDGGALGFSSSGLSWKVYWRATSAGTWGPTADTNDFTMSVAQTQLLNSGTLTETQYLQMVFAFNNPGEYYIVATNASTNSANVAADAMAAWINSSDLNYSACVVENGLTVTDTNSPKRYGYYLSSAQSAYNCATGNTVKYASHPYANYVSTFYNDTSLVSVFTPLVNEYYSFKTSPSPIEPFSTSPTETRVSAKFNTNGLKIDSALIPETCGGIYARWCNNNSITCAHPWVRSYI